MHHSFKVLTGSYIIPYLDVKTKFVFTLAGIYGKQIDQN